MAMKRTVFEETCDTFFSKVLLYLVNTDIDKYYPVGNFGLWALAMGAIHPDIAVLEKYFRGVVPKNLADASKTFQYILKSQKSTHISFENKRRNPVRRFLEEQGVQFPNFSEPTSPRFTTVAHSVQHITPCHQKKKDFKNQPCIAIL